MSNRIAIHKGCATTSEDLMLSEEKLTAWVICALEDTKSSVSLALVDEDIISTLNAQYKGKRNSTNVLAFPMPDQDYLGEIVVCPSVIAIEARKYNMDYAQRFAHMIIHGVLHVRGFDHQHAEQTKMMEDKEIALMEQLGFHSPYEIV